jgi:hypothetical protein
MDGVKYDSKKLRWRLVPWVEMTEVVKVLDFGASKYCEHNWVNVPDARDRYFDAAMRHIMAWGQGERKDEESGISHLAHAVCCLLFIMWFDRKDDEGR